MRIHAFVIIFLTFLSLPCGSADTNSAKAEAAEQEVVLYASDFEDGTGVFLKGQTPFKQNWVSNQAEARLKILPPLGEGNASRGALTCHAGGSKSYVSCELPLHGTLVEPQGWDGTVSFRIYNGGFQHFYAIYLPIMPNDVTFHRAYFDAPEGRWTELDLPLDAFHHHGRRPRRGCRLEYLVFVAEGPRNGEVVFQVDDMKLYRTRQAQPMQPREKPPLADGVCYLQNFDDPADFDIEGFFPDTRNANAFREPGGPGAERKKDQPLPVDSGCLRVACYKKNEDFRGGRQLSFSGSDTRISFDVCLMDATDFAVIGRARQGRFRIYLPQARAETWTRVTLDAADLAPYGVSMREAEGKRLGNEADFFALHFGALAGGSGTSAILIDNLELRKATEAAQPHAPAP